MMYKVIVCIDQIVFFENYDLSYNFHNKLIGLSWKTWRTDTEKKNASDFIEII
jgi:hypothetical protein